MKNIIKNNTKNIIKNKNGEVSVLVIALIFISCIMVSGLVDISMSQWGIRETQVKLDIAGTNALYNSIDLESLKLEELNIGGNSITTEGASSLASQEYKRTIQDNYLNELSRVTYGGKKPVIKHTNVDFVYTNKGLGYVGSATKARPQVSLQSVVSYTVASSVLTDSMGGFTSKIGNSSLSNTKFEISIEDSANDGESILIIQSETKIVLK